MTIVKANGISTHVACLDPVPGAVPATGPATVVMIHGMTSDSLASWFFTLAKPVTEAGFRAVMYDLRGHGHTERPAAGYRMDDFVDDLEALLDTLDVTEPVYLMGNSFGGTVAFGYAARHPDRVAAIVAIESSPPTREWFVRIGKRLRRAASFLPQDSAVAEITANRGKQAGRQAQAIRELIVSTSVLRELPDSPLPSREQLAAIQCPVLCLYGGESGVAELATDVQRLLPNAQTTVVPGHKHSLLVAATDTVRQLIMSWDPIRGHADACDATPAQRVIPRPRHQSMPTSGGDMVSGGSPASGTGRGGTD